ncbi:MAG: gliding motility-associated C-terminal domain-containing protein, partial [Saprospiraceae bacterium]|nr:gliding motility-associated C-terminal domain-containing protein [Saprospiraceae bacterium]MCB0623163.1 gliding motility-associated C-terminal domain-containing protein [Saprospiraceae bacterium]MCB0683367.1 gliding motility-associated C-terminal domain-containing protein [Saprospiraceae bacterium]
TNTVTGCTAVDQVAVTESIGVPEASITVVDVSCFGDDDGFIIVDAIDGGVPPYLCSFEGSAFSSQKQFTNLAAGTYELVIEDSKGCETVVTLTVNQPDELTVELIGDFATTEDIVELGDSVQLSVQLNIPFGEVDSIVWSPASLINCDTCQSNFVTPGITTTFSVWVEDEGCFDEAELRVQVKKTRPVYIPNVFSPNGDGENDVFFIQAGPSVVEIKSFLVFNRWGESVFEINNVPPNSESFGWNGTFRGEILNPGAFAYFAEIEFIDGIVEIYKGDVVLLR